MLGSAWSTYGFNVMTVIIIQDEDTFVATRQRYKERSSLVGVDLTGDWKIFRLNMASPGWMQGCNIVDVMCCLVLLFSGTEI